MEMPIEPNYFVEVFRCCEDCKMSETCINVGHGCCNYKLYEKKVTEDIVTKDGINKKFMRWLWNKDRQKCAYIMFGHIELITDDLIKEFAESEDDE